MAPILEGGFLSDLRTQTHPKGVIVECYELNVCPQNAHIEALPPTVMTFGNGAFGRLGSLDEVIQVRPCGGISPF